FLDEPRVWTERARRRFGSVADRDGDRVDANIKAVKERYVERASYFVPVSKFDIYGLDGYHWIYGPDYTSPTGSAATLNAAVSILDMDARLANVPPGTYLPIFYVSFTFSPSNITNILCDTWCELEQDVLTGSDGDLGVGAGEGEENCEDRAGSTGGAEYVFSYQVIEGGAHRTPWVSSTRQQHQHNTSRRAHTPITPPSSFTFSHAGQVRSPSGQKSTLILLYPETNEWICVAPDPTRTPDGLGFVVVPEIVTTATVGSKHEGQTSVTHEHKKIKRLRYATVRARIRNIGPDMKRGLRIAGFELVRVPDLPSPPA
ncbi:hypothetical protein HDU93_005126, partial [Gonapodya sp. JEL0774]